MIDDTRAEAAVMHIRKSADTYAKAKAQRIYLEEFKRTKRAILMQQAERSGHTTSAAQEREAYANPEYNDLLEGLRVAIETEERVRWEMVSAELTVDIWRTQQANNRRIDKVST